VGCENFEEEEEGVLKEMERDGAWEVSCGRWSGGRCRWSRWREEVVTGDGLKEEEVVLRRKLKERDREKGSCVCMEGLI